MRICSQAPVRVVLNVWQELRSTLRIMLTSQCVLVNASRSRDGLSCEIATTTDITGTLVLVIRMQQDHTFLVSVMCTLYCWPASVTGVRSAGSGGHPWTAVGADARGSRTPHGHGQSGFLCAGRGRSHGADGAFSGAALLNALTISWTALS